MLLYDGFIMYNDLVNEIKKEERLQSFKRALMPYIKSRINAIIQVLVDNYIVWYIYYLI